MLITEEEAGGKWCPHVRIANAEPSVVRDGKDVVGSIVGGCNTDKRGSIRVPASCRCIASGCMMWRWPAGTKIDPVNLGLVQDGLGGYITAKGYCGLAGKP